MRLTDTDLERARELQIEAEWLAAQQKILMENSNADSRSSTDSLPKVRRKAF